MNHVTGLPVAGESLGKVSNDKGAEGELLRFARASEARMGM